METTIVTRETFTVLGVQARIDPKNADYGMIWNQQFMPHHEFIKSLAVEEGYYGVYFATGEPGMTDMLACMRVGELPSQLPEGLVAREIPAAQYVVATCGMNAIGATWQYLYEEWVPNSTEYTVDPTKADFEYFPPNCETGVAPVTIYVPVRKK